MRAVVDSRNLDEVLLHAVHGDVRQGRKNKFPPPVQTAARAAHRGETLQLRYTAVDDGRDPPGSFRVVALDPAQIRSRSSIAGTDQRIFIRAEGSGAGARLPVRAR